MIGLGKPLDTEKFFVIGDNKLGATRQTKATTS